MEEQVSGYVAHEPKVALPPPANESGIIGWMRTNLFATPVDSVLTIVLSLLAAWVVYQLVNWGIITAVFTGQDRTACLPQNGQEVGACWAFIRSRFSQFIYGLYPVDQRWRVDWVFAMFAVLLLALAIPRVPFKKLSAVLFLAVFPPIAFVLLTGGRLNLSGGTIAFFFVIAAAITLVQAVAKSPTVNRSIMMKVAKPLFVLAIVLTVASWFLSANRVNILTYQFTVLSALAFFAALGSIVLSIVAAVTTSEEKAGVVPLLVPALAAGALAVLLSTHFGLIHVPTNLWGGLLVTLVVAVVGIVASLPIGVLLALGRQSRMPAVRLVSVVFIEFWRGVPLITVLFMANFMLPLFMPSGVSFNQLLRVLVGVALFSAAYMAEVIRGGLQAIPKGQYEGADAMALTYWQKMRMIILPQALRLVIPGIVNTFIGLFKDTSLVYIIGLADLLGTVRRGFNDPAWITPSTPATGLVFAGFVFWLFCFAMSRYSIYMERRLSAGQRR